MARSMNFLKFSLEKPELKNDNTKRLYSPQMYRLIQNKANGPFDLQLLILIKNQVHQKFSPHFQVLFLVCTAQLQHDAIYLTRL